MLHSTALIGASESSIHAALAARLAAIAYSQPDDIETQVRQLGSQWDAVWVPTESVAGNFAYIAFNGEQYVVAIRGSVFVPLMDGFYDWLVEDFNVFVQVDWPFSETQTAPLALLRQAQVELSESSKDATSPKPTPKVSKGTLIGLQHLLALKSASGQSMWDFLESYCVMRHSNLAITGHSLGAGLAPLLAMWLRQQILGTNYTLPALFAVITFAAPAAGNHVFADLFDQAFPLSWRYFNELDLVPMAPAGLFGAADLYPAPCPQADQIELDGGLTLARALDALQLAILAADAMRNDGSFYAHTNRDRGSIPLNLKHELFSPKSTDPLLDWFEQVGHQHALVNYLKWL